MSSKQFDRLILMIEAILIIISLAVSGQALVGMICYWSIVAMNHLTDLIAGSFEDRDGKNK